MTRWPLLALTLIACALTFAACGGDDDPKDSAAAGILERTFASEKEVESGRLDLTLKLDGGLAGTPGTSALRLSGPFATTDKGRLPRFDFQIALDGGGQALELGAVSTGGKGFLRFADQTFAMTPELYQQLKAGYEQQAKQNAKQARGATFQALGVDPRRWLKDPKVAGEQRVGGVAATHVRSGVNVERFLDDLTKILQRPELAQAAGGQAREITPAQREVLARSIEDASVDVWTGKDDRILRRLNVAMRFDVSKDDEDEAQGIEDGSLRFDLALGAVNERQRIVAPKDAKPLEGLLGALAGAARPGGGQPRGAQPQMPGGGSSDYMECVQSAGGDVKKMQECAKLAGG